MIYGVAGAVYAGLDAILSLILAVPKAVGTGIVAVFDAILTLAVFESSREYSRY